MKRKNGTSAIWNYQFKRFMSYSPTYVDATKYIAHIRPTLYIHKSNVTKVS